MASIDQTFARGYRLMFSDEPDSAAQLRAMLDEAIRNKYGVCLQIPPEVDVEEPRQLIEGKSNPPKDDTPSSSEDSNDCSAVNFEDSFSMHLTDLSCVVCGQLNVGVHNQLIECNGCQKLYHQDCHIPPIKELIDSNSLWKCVDCEGNSQVQHTDEDAFLHLEEEFKPDDPKGDDPSPSIVPCVSLDVDHYLSQSSSNASSALKPSYKMNSHLKVKRHSSALASSHYKSSHSSSNRHSR